MFKSLKLNSWRQYENINIDFHPRLTILTGANGSGKTTLLNIINRHFGWPGILIGTPKKDNITGKLKFFSDIWKSIIDYNRGVEDVHNKKNEVGKIIYQNDLICTLFVPNIVNSTYSITLHDQQEVKGLHIPSHRPIYKYNPILNISTNVVSKQNAFAKYSSTLLQRYQGGSSSHSENYFIKEALISLATFGYGNEVVNKNEAAVQIFEGFQNILKIVLPPKLGFQNISIRIPEVILVTKSGEFSLDAVSGGIASIIDLAWQIYMFDDGVNNYTITFDEPENHLHPEMQKTLLPNFLKAFPKAQFIIATHNPFIISSVPDSNVYVLNYDINNKVKSILLENIEKSGTANDILMEVLGIETTMPNWVDDKIDLIISKYTNSGITPENLQSFKNDLRQVGLEKYVTASVGELIEKSRRND